MLRNTSFFLIGFKVAMFIVAIGLHIPPTFGQQPGEGNLVSSPEQLRALMPGLSIQKAKDVFPSLQKAMKEFHIDTPQRQAAFLAQLGVESISLTRLHEKYTTKPFRLLKDHPVYTAKDEKDYFNHWYGNRKDLGNIKEDDGYKFRGQGFIQLTGRYNYERADKELGLKGALIANPDLAADPKLAARLAGWYWQDHHLNDYADQLDVTNSDFNHVVNAISRGINLGNPTIKTPAYHEGRRGAATVRALQTVQPPHEAHTGLYDEVAKRLRDSLGLVLGTSTREDVMNRILQTSPFDSFGGIVLGNAPIAQVRVRSAGLVYAPDGIRLQVEAEGREGTFLSEEFSATEMWCAYQFLYPDGERHRLGAREKDFGLVGILKNNIKADGSWSFSLHPAVANTILANDAMRMDMVLSLEDPRLPRLPSGWKTYRWHDERAVISVENGKILIRPLSGPALCLLRCKLWDDLKEMPFDLNPLVAELYPRHNSMQAIDRFAKLLAIFNWLDRDGMLYAMPDKVQPVLVNQPNKFYQADLTYEGLTIVRDTLDSVDPRDREYKDSPCKVHEFSMEPGNRYVVEVISNFNPFLRIEDSNGKSVAADDDSAGNRDPRILFRPAVRDDYRFIVTAVNPKSTGYYTLRIWEGDIGPGQTMFEWFGTLKQDNPRDAVLTASPCQVLYVNLDERMSYLVQLGSKDFDPFLRVEDLNRKQLAYNSGSRERKAFMVFSPPKTALYRIVATNSNALNGNYTLTIERSFAPLGTGSFKSTEARKETEPEAKSAQGNNP